MSEIGFVSSGNAIKCSCGAIIVIGEDGHWHCTMEQFPSGGEAAESELNKADMSSGADTHSGDRLVPPPLRNEPLGEFEVAYKFMHEWLKKVNPKAAANHKLRIKIRRNRLAALLVEYRASLTSATAPQRTYESLLRSFDTHLECTEGESIGEDNIKRIAAWLQKYIPLTSATALDQKASLPTVLDRTATLDGDLVNSLDAEWNTNIHAQLDLCGVPRFSLHDAPFSINGRFRQLRAWKITPTAMDALGILDEWGEGQAAAIVRRELPKLTSATAPDDMCSSCGEPKNCVHKATCSATEGAGVGAESALIEALKPFQNSSWARTNEVGDIEVVLTKSEHSKLLTIAQKLARAESPSTAAAKNCDHSPTFACGTYCTSFKRAAQPEER